MPRGGTRPGAGRPAGVRNKKTSARLEAIAASGDTPLDYLLGVMRDAANELATRLDAAKAAAPYIHARLSAVEVTGEIEQKHYVVTAEPLTEAAWQQKYGGATAH